MSVGFWQIIILLIIILLYFLPYVVAKIRKIKNSASVFWLNLFLGWTVLGYFVLLFYAALTSATKDISVTEFIKGKSKKKNNTILNIYYLGQHARAPDYKINCQQVAIATRTNLQQSVCSHGKDYDSYYREL